MIFHIIILVGILCVGIRGDTGLIIGERNPASFTAMTNILKESSISFSNVTYKIPPSDSLIFSMASDPKEGVIFTAIGNSIYMFPNFSVWQNSSVKFTNQFKGLNRPEGLALDPADRLLFFSNNYPISRIEKASLDGQNREVIIHKGLSRVLSLAVDTANDKLYWADYGRYTLEGSDYDGSNRRVILHRNFVSVTGIAYHQNNLHAISMKEGSMFAVDITSGSYIYFKKYDSFKPFAITVYDSESTGTFNDPCSTLNCQHMCVDTLSGPKCLCSEGFDLDSNGNTCTDKSWFFKKGFIVSNTSVFAMHEVHSISGGPPVYYNRTLSNSIIETFAVDAKSDIIYFVDSGSNSLKRHDIILQKTSTLTTLTAAKDLIFDWIANLLGWIEPTLSSIRTFSVNSQSNVLIYSSLQQPMSLTVDPHNGTLFWISGTSGKSVVRGSWTRDVPQTLISSANLNEPSSLQYDVTSNRLYWIDRNVIKSSTTSGIDIKSHLDTNGATKAFVYKGFLGWINKTSIHFARMTATSAEDVLNTLPNCKDVSVFDSSLQEDKRGTCDILNGGCEEICVPETIGRRCGCDIGLQLQSDQSCDSDVLLANFIVMTDYTHGRILQIDLQTGTLVKLPLSLNMVLGLAFDKTTKTLFYSEASTNTITSTTVHGDNRTLFYNTGFAYANSLAIDYSTLNLYYIAIGPTIIQSIVGVVHRSKLVHKTLINNLHKPRDIALYPSKGIFFWTEIGNITGIGKANMDGTSNIYIVTTAVGSPTGLTVDASASRLYWADWLKDRIESSDLNGGNRQVLATDSGAYIYDIMNLGQYIFYTAWNRQRVTKIDKNTGLKVDFMPNHPELGRLDSLDIYADDLRDVSSSCSTKNGLCSTFCFPTPTGRTCGCQDNVNLQSDQLTCQGVFRCPTQLQHLNFVDCAPYPGLACDFKCKVGYQPVANNTAFCDSTGKWFPSIDTLCVVTKCPLDVDNATLSPTCRGTIGEKCDVICNGGTSMNTAHVVCLSSGVWDRDTAVMCSIEDKPATKCPLDVENATLSSTCRGTIGEKCDVFCNGGTSVNTAHVVCLSSGVWDRDIAVMCSPADKPERYTPPEASKKDMTYIYTGISIAGVVVVVMVVIGVFFVKKRRDNPAQDRSPIQNALPNANMNVYTTTVNAGYDGQPESDYCDITSYLDTNVYEEPLKKP
uniref:EGF-like domain-containing protein n=1 Tax=Magallana gigas TaxID=29159 RepID=A0A8W8MRC5_MAGGI